MANFKVIHSIERLGYSVTSGAVAVETGLSLDSIEDELRALLCRCGGDFEVTGEAENESVR